MPSKRTASKTHDDAIALLMEDHRRVEQLFKEAEKLGDEDTDELQGIVEEACTELTIHSQLEEELVYPVFRDAIEDEDLVLEAEVEHQSAHDLIAALEAMDPTDERYKATFTVLGEYVMHHVREEEKEMFPQAKKSDIDLSAMAEELRTRKEELKAELEGTEEESGAESPKGGARS